MQVSSPENSRLGFAATEAGRDKTATPAGWQGRVWTTATARRRP